MSNCLRSNKFRISVSVSSLHVCRGWLSWLAGSGVGRAANFTDVWVACCAGSDVEGMAGCWTQKSTRGKKTSGDWATFGYNNPRQSSSDRFWPIDQKTNHPHSMCRLLANWTLKLKRCLCRTNWQKNLDQTKLTRFCQSWPNVFHVQHEKRRQLLINHLVWLLSMWESIFHRLKQTQSGSRMMARVTEMNIGQTVQRGGKLLAEFFDDATESSVNRFNSRRSPGKLDDALGLQRIAFNVFEQSDWSKSWHCRWHCCNRCCWMSLMTPTSGKS